MKNAEDSEDFLYILRRALVYKALGMIVFMLGIIPLTIYFVMLLMEK